MKFIMRTIDEKRRVVPTWIGGFVLGFLLCVFACAAMFKLTSRANGLVVVTFAMNGILSGIMIVSSSRRRRYSLETIHWIFFFFFFFFAPIIQYSYGAFPWELQATTDELFKANILLFAWGILFFLGSKVRVKKDKAIADDSNEKALHINPSVLNLFIMISILITIYYVINVGFGNLLSHGTNSSFFIIEQQSLSLLFLNATRSFVLFTFVFCVLNKQGGGFQCCISLVCLLICIFPLGVARNAMAIVYVGLFALLFEKFLTGRKFTYIFLLGLIIVFPLLNVFRHASLGEAQVGKALQKILTDFLNEYTAGDYDAYSMFIQTIRYTARFGIEYGMQFVGAMLFFIPRTIWEGKPIGTGATIFTKWGRDFTNVSCPLPSEFFINFGGVGLLVSAFAVGYLARRLDNAYWKRQLLRKEKQFSYIDIIYPFLIPAFFFIMRGDLMSSFAYTSAYIVVAYFMYFIAIKKGKFGL